MTPLVCPRCRSAEEGRLLVRVLPDSGPLRHCACGAAYPVVDGIPVVFRDMDAWLSSEGPELLRRPDLNELGDWIAVRSGGSLRRNSELSRVYARSTKGPLQDWLERRVGALTGRMLELGAGLGSGREDVVALDANFALLRGNTADERVCGDAADPPFRAESFEAVVAANLLDSVKDPFLVLAQAAALLCTGGTLVVTCAYAFQDAITPPEARFSEQELLAGLRGEQPFGGYSLCFGVDEVVERIEWPLVMTDRTRHVHEVQVIVARKQAQ